MSAFVSAPVFFIYLYKLTGIVQFSTNNTPFSKFLARLWCLPLYAYFIYVTVAYSMISRNILGIFKYVDKMAGYTSGLTMLVSIFMFYRRSDELKSLLTKLDSIEIYLVGNNGRYSRRDNWVRVGLIGTIVIYILTFPFVHMNYNSSFYYFIPPIVASLNHLFLKDILNCIWDKFELINQHFQRQINSVDLFVIFPLTKAEKVRTLKEDEITFNIQRIQELSHAHYNLVLLTTRITALFDITTIMSMMMWFGCVIDTIYYIMYVTNNDIEDDVVVVYAANMIYLMFCFYWLFFMVGMFSTTQKKANKTATYVHDIWNKYALKNEVDRRVRHLQLISVRLLNTRLQITAKDFFNLDWTFCHMMIAAITTYLVILIQFN
ncbi:putative gustatory receptor 28b [Tenebrio molitor]|uniref:putative gustatory receptor 28b n=1 Tax=Tenebrio molitor TaxID=7067 RepID=UPI00362487EA